MQAIKTNLMSITRKYKPYNKLNGYNQEIQAIITDDRLTTDTARKRHKNKDKQKTRTQSGPSPPLYLSLPSLSLFLSLREMNAETIERKQRTRI